MPQYNTRQPVVMKVSHQQGYVTEIWLKDMAPTSYKVLTVNNGLRTTTWVPEHELEAMPEGEFPPFPNPYVDANSAA